MNRTNSQTSEGRRPFLATVAGLVAVSAWAGAVALATGVVDMGAAVEARFPFGSVMFAGLMLAVTVAMPMTVAARRAATGAPRAGDTAIVAGALLVGWIVVQVAVIQTVSWLQPTMAAAGAAVLFAGLWPRLHGRAG